MALLERPEVTKLENGGSCWEHEYDSFYLKAYIPANKLDGQTNNYGYKAPLLMIFEENRFSMDDAIKFAEDTGLASILQKLEYLAEKSYLETEVVIPIILLPFASYKATS